ncbi:Uma2 family endonuclease [Streptomyces sp. NPDC050636]|uniref:Uma2 family endonuclease n=1 Tax=Streptomyces sp. NPDC050636 TaxID=3154510 RepID=UPI003429A438
MTAMAHEPMATDEETLLDYFLALKTPKGFQAELIEGEIVVTPPTDGDHEDYLSTLKRQVLRKSAADMDESANKGIKAPSSGEDPANRLIPDAVYAPRDLRIFRGAEPWMPCDGITMVVEVTSSKPFGDRTTKRHCYARAGIPLYLLVDRDKSTITLFSDPIADDYVGNITTPFGKPIPLPAPFSFDLDTNDFL